MAQFDVYTNPHLLTSVRFPLLLEVQSDLLENFDSTVVAPLAPARVTGPKPVLFLMPEVFVDGRYYTVMTPQLCVMDRRDLGTKRGDAAAARNEIHQALSFLFRGL